MVGVVAVSFSAILIRVADAPPLALGFWRCALGAVALAPFTRREPASALSRRGHASVAAAGALLGLHFALFITSLELTTVASSTVLVTMSPLFVGAGAAVVLREPPSRRGWVGIGVALAGAVGVAVADAGGGGGDRALAGDGLAFAGAAAMAAYLLIGRAARRAMPATKYAASVNAVAAAVLLAGCGVAGIPLTGYTPATWWAIAGLVVGPQLLGHAVFSTVLSQVTATTVAVVILAEPVGATVLAALLLDEVPAAGFWLAAPVLLAGVHLAATRSPAGPAASGPPRVSPP